MGNQKIERPNIEVEIESEISDQIADDPMTRFANADVAQLAERVLGKDEVSSSILDIGSTVAR
jgi:hypothetical protein